MDGPRFRRLDPVETGVDFTNRLRKENVIPYIYSGAGVAIGDYDRDGLPDLYLVSQDGPNRLFRQVAPLRFEDVTESAGGLDGGDAWGTAATFADIDGDHDLDLYVCNTEAPNLLYRNEGDGTFREVAGRIGLSVTRASTGASFADYDNDGDLDLYLLTNRVFGPRLPEPIVREVTLPADTKVTIDEMFPPHPRFERDGDEIVVPDGYEEFFYTIGDQVFPTGQRDILFRNDGYAQWRDVTDSAGVAHFGQGLSVTWWDYDGDGNLDLYVANDLESPDKLFHNRGDGTFEDVTREALPHTAYFGMGADFGDIDNDGRFDFCVADMSSTSHYMSKLLMGHMGDKRWFLMNADPPQYMRNAVYINTGTGRFLEAARLTGLASTDWTWTVRFADLDEDGLVDFFATNGMASFDNDPDANDEFRRLWNAGVKDAALDIVRGLERVDERNVARRNRGNWSFEDVGSAWGLDEASVANGAAIADLDRDGDLDIVVNNTNAPASIFENRTNRTHRILVELRGSESNAFGVGCRIEIEAAGVRQVRMVIPTRGYMSSGECVEHFGLGDTSRVERIRIDWPSGRTQEFRDLESDRHYTFYEPAAREPDEPEAAPAHGTTMLTAEPNRLPRHVERDFDDYAIQPLLPHRLSRFGPGVACSDVDGDGNDDLWIGGAAGQPGTLALTRADGTFEILDGPWRQDAECEDMGAVFFDHDGDGDLDLLVASGSIEPDAGSALLADRIYDNLGDGRFARVDDLPSTRRFPSTAVAVADFDRDGDLDVFIGSHAIRGRFPEAAPSTLYRNEGGRFHAVDDPVFTRLGLVSSATWSDFDDDGWPDLWIASTWQPVRVLRNVEGTFEDVTDRVGLADAHGQWNSITAADLDADGDVDYVVGNLGLNTKYHADEHHPMRLFAKDFDDDGVRDVVESKYEGDRLLPVRGRSCSTSAMPFLGEKFQTFQAFARATLPEIYGQDQLASSQDLFANHLEHVVLENLGGRFAIRPLPRRAQISSVDGIAIEQLDGDVLPDLLLVHNSFAPEPETGRFDGGAGAVLRNLGGCRFEVVEPTRSGFVVPGDGQGIARLQRDSARADFVVVRNDDEPRMFGAERAGLVVRLRGRAGNPQAVGARITFTQGDRSWNHTVSAGCGYLSQTSPTVFFPTVPNSSKNVAVAIRWPDGATTRHELGSSGVHVVRQ
ncbi:MAG: VCBS repeat-containing protein [Planctomycetes bacterium]|nr:VCBS repeat-containing protein [Planctomycetota bacterium]